MTLFSLLKHVLNYLWKDPRSPQDHASLESAGALELHRSIILGKPLLAGTYESWFENYRQVTCETLPLRSLKMIELGSGAGLVRNFVPEVVRTDVVEHPLVDEVITGDSLPHPDHSLRAIFMTNVLHHMANPRRFFAEANRCLAVGGRMLMIEPANTFWGRFIWGNFHPNETFDPTFPTWEYSTRGRLIDANMAIPWIIFVRDRAQFESEFPDLRIVQIRRHTILSYCLSGGLSYRAFVPPLLSRSVLALDRRLAKILPGFGTMMTIELERVEARRLAA